MPSRVLEWQTSFEMLKGDNGEILPLKVFGCVCFVKDNRPIVRKLDPRAVKCIFVGYSGTQKWYVCWNPMERRLFVCMNVIFREHEPYYSLEVRSPFSDSPNTGSIRREEENSGNGKVVTVGVIPCPMPREESTKDETDNLETEFDTDTVGSETRRFGNVYTRRKQNEEELPSEPPMPISPLSRSTPTPEAPTSSNTDSVDTGDTIPLFDPSMTLRRTSRSNTERNPDRYGFLNILHDIAQFVSYSNISPVHETFIASLNIISIPKCWHEAIKNPKLRATMLEELGALDKNKT
jgi:hypothetical protein